MVKKREQIVWSAEENEKLLQLVEKGQSPARVAGVFNRSMSSVQSQARRLGKPFPSLLERRRAMKEKMSLKTHITEAV